MSLTFNLMENDVFRPIIMQALMQAQVDSELIGEQKGETKILMRLLQRRFGAVPGWASEKISEADLPSLEEWSLRVLDAQSLDDVFSDKM
ncbi:MAG: DUF4351 domain-containing protein [Nitrospirae bacterium]|nr:DUF4351 domain-containing protein [Magnetococcales bacterium]